MSSPCLAEQSTTIVFKSSEQVVPVNSLEGDYYMKAEIPNEKGAAALQSISTMEIHNVKDAPMPITDETEQEAAETNQYSVNIEDESDQHYSEQYSLQLDEDANQHEPTQYSFQSNNPQWSSRYLMQLEGDTDMGYSSHSACSSCQQGSQADSGQNNVNFPDMDHTDDCFNGDEEMEDLLFHFDTFFSNRYKELLQEQEMHVRQIVKKVIRTCNDKDGITDTVEVIDKATQTDEIEKFSVTCSISDESACQACDRSETEELTSSRISLDENTRIIQKDKLLQRVISLTCDINGLLQKKEYKT